jgi:hypothetical protein
MKPTPNIRIRSMRVRAPGADKEAGHALVQSLRERISDLPGSCQPAHIGSLRLRISGEAGVEPSAISHAIANMISSKLTSK